jgi:hypothetical protein
MQVQIVPVKTFLLLGPRFPLQIAILISIPNVFFSLDHWAQQEGYPGVNAIKLFFLATDNWVK